MKRVEKISIDEHPDEDNTNLEDRQEAATLFNADKESNSAITFAMDVNSFYRNPTTIANTSNATAKIELQLHLLYKELEHERSEREKLEK